MKNDKKDEKIIHLPAGNRVTSNTTSFGQIKNIKSEDIKLKTLRQHSFNTKVTIGSKSPQIILKDSAYDKHCCLCSIVEARTNDEVSWIGSVIREDHLFIIDDIFLIDQEVHSGETEMYTKGLGDLATKLINQGDLEIANRLMYWGHYHTFPSHNPSGQDERQLLEFKDTGYPFFIRGIACRNGTIKFDIYLIDSGLVFLDVPWNRETSVNISVMEQLNSEFTEKIKSVRRVYTYSKWPYQNYGSKYGPHQRNISSQIPEVHASAGKGTFRRNTKKVVIIPDEVEMTEEEFWGQWGI